MGLCSPWLSGGKIILAFLYSFTGHVAWLCCCKHFLLPLPLHYTHYIQSSQPTNRLWQQFLVPAIDPAAFAVVTTIPHVDCYFVFVAVVVVVVLICVVFHIVIEVEDLLHPFAIKVMEKPRCRCMSVCVCLRAHNQTMLRLPLFVSSSFDFVLLFFFFLGSVKSYG